MNTTGERKIKQTTFIFFTAIGNGIFWLASGIIPLLPISKVVELIAGIVLLLLLLPQFKIIASTKETFDELAKEHDRLAKTFCFYFSALAFMFIRFLAYIPIINNTISCKETISFALGILYLSYGIAFIVLEKRDSYSAEETFEEE